MMNPPRRSGPNWAHMPPTRARALTPPPPPAVGLALTVAQLTWAINHMYLVACKTACRLV